MKRKVLLNIFGSVLTVALFFGALTFFVHAFFIPRDTTFGVSYSNIQARYLGLNELETYNALFTELGVKHVRLPLYWNEIENGPDDYNWWLIDHYLNEAEKYGADVTLVIGYKTPRWPECHIPRHIDTGDEASFERHLLKYLELAALRYKEHPALERWQIENEPLFPFGECPMPNLELLRQEIALMKSLDPHHPVQLTVSGEQEAWADLALPADVLGASLYRFAWNDRTGLTVYPHSSMWYSIHRAAVAPWVDNVIISELQAEPWFQDGKIPDSIADAYALFPLGRLQEHIRFARETQFPEVYMWGVEWWYYLHKHGEDRLWNEGKALFSSPNL